MVRLDLMNTLERWLLSRDIDARLAMNHLQDAGVISDECVWPADVAEADILTAIAHLEAVYLRR